MIEEIRALREAVALGEAAAIHAACDALAAASVDIPTSTTDLRQVETCRRDLDDLSALIALRSAGTNRRIHSLRGPKLTYARG